MRRSSFGRAFAALFALWFAISLAEPAALHACPMHGAGSANAHAHSAMSHHAAATEHSLPDSQNAGKHCTCLGSCCASSANAAVPATAVSVEPVATYETERQTPTEIARAITASPFFLPYANGPPQPASDA
jgi:hypothetical protein